MVDPAGSENIFRFGVEEIKDTHFVIVAGRIVIDYLITALQLTKSYDRQLYKSHDQSSKVEFFCK